MCLMVGFFLVVMSPNGGFVALIEFYLYASTEDGLPHREGGDPLGADRMVGGNKLGLRRAVGDARLSFGNPRQGCVRQPTGQAEIYPSS